MELGNTPLRRLGLLDKLRYVLKYATYNPANELSNQDTYNKAYLELLANCYSLLYKSAKPIRKGIHRSVTINVSSEFQPVIKQVIRIPRLKRYYKINVKKPKTDYNTKFMFVVRMTVR